MSAHTQKTWRWVEGTGDIRVDWNNKSWTIATVTDCQLGWHEDRNCEGREAGANARLIATAPKLLKALQSINKETPTDIANNEDSVVLIALSTKQIFTIRAVIAEATGGEA